MVWFVDMSPAFAVFLGLSFMGTFFVLTSLSVVGVWFGLECNFFGFVPLLNGKTTEEGEGAMKYFIVQGLGSAFIFVGVCFLLMESWDAWSLSVNLLAGIMFLSGMMMKVGLFPFHFWFPSVMGGSSWFNCFMLSSWQKLGVFFVISGIGVGAQVSSLVVTSAILTSAVGGVGGVGQVYFRPIMAYSSLVHSGWMTVVSLISEVAFLIYYFIYSAIVYYLFRMISYLQSDSLGAFSTSGFLGSGHAWVWVLVSLLSLGGLPPLLGSGLKLLGIMVSFPVFKVGLMVLVVSSVVGLFYYLSVVFSSSLHHSAVFSLAGLSGEVKVSLMKSSFWSFAINTMVGIVAFIGLGNFIL